MLDSERFPILQGMAPILIEILNNSSNLMHVSEDVELLHEGDTAHDLYFIESGAVAIAKHVQDGNKRVRELGDGDVFGEFGTLRGKVRFASVYTTEISRIIRVKLAALQQVLEIDTGFHDRLTRLMNQRMLSSFISSHKAFEGLSKDTLAELADTLSLRFIAEDEPIFKQGESLDAAYMIVSGEAEVRLDGDVEMLLEVRRDNDVLGGTKDSEGYASYSAYASSDADLLVLDRAALDLVGGHSPEVAAHLESFIAQRAAKTLKRIGKQRA